MENSIQQSSHSSRWRVPFILLVTVICVILPCMVRFAPRHWTLESIVALEQVRKELPLAEARWKAHNITDYEIDVRAIVHPTVCHDINDITFSPLHLKIDKGEIVFDNNIQKGYVDGCGIDMFLPPKVFDVVRRKIETAEPLVYYLKVEFDPEYGFVSEYVASPNSRNSDGLVEYIFTNFRPKSP